jgi:hypothetical protein
MHLEVTCQVDLNRLRMVRIRTVSCLTAGQFPKLREIQTRRIITSVDLISAAATCPFSSRISRTASEVMTEVIC